MSTPTNASRATRAQIALWAYQGGDRLSPDEALRDLLSDLMHWAAKNNVYFENELDTAERNFAFEDEDES